MSNIKRKKLNIIKKKARDYVASLKRDNFLVNNAFLFGSYAKKSFTDNSDIDICVVSENFNDSDKDRLFLWQKRREVDVRIEPLGYNLKDFKDSDPLVAEIKEYGVKLA